MRRLFVVGVVLVAGAGCSKFRNTFSANADVAAEVRGVTLKSDRVSQMLKGPAQRPNIDAAAFVTGLWTDYSLFSQAAIKKEIKTDSATIASAMWFDLAQARVQTLRDTLMARRIHLSPNAADSIYTKGDLRVFQHILVTPAGATAADTAKAKAAAAKLLQEVKSGTSFGTIAGKTNPDASRQDGGYLPVGPRGGFVQPFDSVAWNLAPGAVSGVVQTQFGFHLIRRPPFTEVKDRFGSWLNQQAMQKQDSAFAAELQSTNKIEVQSGAVPAIRSALNDREGSKGSSKTLVTYKGGSLSVGEFLRWVSVLPAGYTFRLKSESDSNISQFAKLISEQVIMLHQADSAGIKVPAANWGAVQLGYRAAVGALTKDLGLDGPEFSDSSKSTTNQRSKLAAQKVDQYFDRLMAGQTQMRNVPPGLVASLRSSGDYHINQAGLTRAIELSVAKFRVDSAAAAARGTGGAPGGPVGPDGAVRRAPGGAPVPGKKP